MVSIIIPTFNEEKVHPETLHHLVRQPGHFEIIVVDGGSIDHTGEIVRREPGVRLLTAPKGRASQMNPGARHASGDWLLFLHADTLLPKGARARLNALETDATVQAGGLLHQFSGTNWRLRMFSYFNNVRCRWSKIIYGDQAMFVRRTLFAQLRGSPNEPILEDVSFSRKLVRIVAPMLLAPPVITNSRKFVQMGIWRSAAGGALILLSIQLHIPLISRAFFREIR